MNFKFELTKNIQVSASACGVLLPGANNFVLWGITYKRVQELVLKLDSNLRTCKRKDWIYFRLERPFAIIGYLIMIFEYIFGDVDYQRIIFFIALFIVGFFLYLKL